MEDFIFLMNRSQLKKTLHKYFIFVVLGLMAIIVVSSPMLKNEMNLPKYYKQLFEEAKVTRIVDQTLEEDHVIPGMQIGKQSLEIEVLTGKYKGNTYETVNLLSRGHNVYATEGLHVIVGLREVDDGSVNAWVYNHKREGYIYLLIGLFFTLLLIFGGMKGLHAALSLVFTGIMIVFVMIPLIFKGNNPMIVSIACTLLLPSYLLYLLVALKEKQRLP